MLAGKRARMSNGLIYVCISIGSVLFIGSWSLYLAVMLDRANKLIEKQKREIAQMVLPPFQVAKLLPKIF